MKTTVIIVAAGEGSRFGADLPKQYVDLCGRPVLMHTIDAFRNALPGCEIMLVISPGMEELWNSLCDRHHFASPKIFFGGPTRAQSVFNAVRFLDSSGIVLIHDGARPMVSKGLICRGIEHLNQHPELAGVIPAVAVTDSLRAVDDGGIYHAVDRRTMRAVQTPQIFRSSRLIVQYARACDNLAKYTDDASLFADSEIGLFPGDPSNIKITHPQDIATAAWLLKK